MTDLRLAAESLSGLMSRRKRHLSAVSRVLGIPYDQLEPSADWNSCTVSSYLESRPLCLYFEPSFTHYYRYLEKMYGNNLTLFASDFTSCGHDLWKAIDTAESIAKEIEKEDLDRLEPNEVVTRYLNPWYLRLVEQAFDSLLGFAEYRLQSNAGKQSQSQPRNIYEAVSKHGWYWAGEFYRPTLRNGIAHNVDIVQDTALSQASVIYTDLKGQTETLTVSDLVDEVTGMSDECIAYAFALRLFALEHSHDVDVEPVLRASASNRSQRERGFRDRASSRSLVVESVRTDVVNGKKQTRIECLDYCRIEPERLSEMVGPARKRGWVGVKSLELG